jgi:hypothetical protein
MTKSTFPHKKIFSDLKNYWVKLSEKFGKLDFVIFIDGKSLESWTLSFLMAEKDAESWTLSFLMAEKFGK